MFILVTSERSEEGHLAQACEHCAYVCWDKVNEDGSVVNILLLSRWLRVLQPTVDAKLLAAITAAMLTPLAAVQLFRKCIIPFPV